VLLVEARTVGLMQQAEVDTTGYCEGTPERHEALGNASPDRSVIP